MARHYPAICTEFLKRMQDDFIHINFKYPKLRIAKDALRRVGDCSIVVTHRRVEFDVTFPYTVVQNPVSDKAREEVNSLRSVIACSGCAHLDD